MIYGQFEGFEFEIEIVKESVRGVEENQNELFSLHLCVDEFYHSWEPGALLVEIFKLGLKGDFDKAESVLDVWMASLEGFVWGGIARYKGLETLSVNRLAHSLGFVAKEVLEVVGSSQVLLSGTEEHQENDGHI